MQNPDLDGTDRKPALLQSSVNLASQLITSGTLTGAGTEVS